MMLTVCYYPMALSLTVASNTFDQSSNYKISNL